MRAQQAPAAKVPRPIIERMKTATDGIAALAMRLRRVTSLPIALCHEFLAALEVDARERYVEHFEVVGGIFLIDPVELEPRFWGQIASVRAEALARAGAGAFGAGMGLGGRMAHWQQQELLTRYGIAWRTPQQMNPNIAFD